MLAADRAGNEGRAFNDSHAFEDWIHQRGGPELRDFRTSTRFRICSAIRRTGAPTTAPPIENALMSMGRVRNATVGRPNFVAGTNTRASVMSIAIPLTMSLSPSSLFSAAIGYP